MRYKRKFDASFSFIALKEFLLPTQEKPFFSQYCLASSPPASMAASSETPSATDQTTSSGLLSININQNLILDIYSFKYDEFLQLLIECPRYSPLAPTLSMIENAPLVHLSTTFSTSRYQESGSIITFEVGSQHTSIIKSRLSRLIGFPSSRDFVDPESIFLLLFWRCFTRWGIWRIL